MPILFGVFCFAIMSVCSNSAASSGVISSGSISFCKLIVFSSVSVKGIKVSGGVTVSVIISVGSNNSVNFSFII